MNISAKRSPGEQGGHRQEGRLLKSRRGFGYNAHMARARPRNTPAKELIGNEVCTEAALSFPRGTDVQFLRFVSNALGSIHCGIFFLAQAGVGIYVIRVYEIVGCAIGLRIGSADCPRGLRSLRFVTMRRPICLLGVKACIKRVIVNDREWREPS